MKCIFCSSPETKVLDKRDVSEATVTRRRRMCISCERRFTTYERAELIFKMVVKKDGRREQFNEDKLRKGVQRACEKRPISTEQIEAILTAIGKQIQKSEGQEISSEKIGEKVMLQLKKIDDVAYIRFASVYKSFCDVESFERELKEIKSK